VTVCKTVRPMLSDRSVCPVCLSVTLVYYDMMNYINVRPKADEKPA